MNHSRTSQEHSSTTGQDIKANRQGGYNNRQAGKCVGYAGLISLTYGLFTMGSVSIKHSHRMEYIN